MLRRLAILTATGCAAAAALIPGATSAPQAVDIALSIGATETNPFRSAVPSVPNGGSVTVSRLDFYVLINVDLITPQAARAKIRFELGGGLRWGPDDPDPSEGCTSTPTTGECDTPEMLPIAGQSGGSWYWDVRASQPGTYSFRAEIVEATDTDPDPSNNSSQITIVVTEGSGSGGSGGGSGGSGGGGGGGGGTGGSASVASSAAKVSPAKPKAGSTVVASVRVARGGSPARPEAIACNASIGGVKVKGGAKAASGLASCLFKTPRTAKGKTLAGSVSFSAGGKRFTKRFSVRLG
ncbi:MAG: hypothetical protein R6W48_07355 [Gaiellaceae bacterium]